MLKSVVKGLQYVNFVDESFLPEFMQFQIKKIPIYDKIEEVNPSFIVCFVDQSNKILAEKSLKGEKELVALINSTISHEMRNPLNIVINHTQIIKDKISKFFKFFETISGQVDKTSKRIIQEFHTHISRSNDICCYSSDKLILNIEAQRTITYVFHSSLFILDQNNQSSIRSEENDFRFVYAFTGSRKI